MKNNQKEQDDEGFSSEEEVKQEFIFNLQKSQQMRQQDEQKKSHQLSQNFNNKSYSLHPDIITGWIPKIHLPNPIPLMFDNQQLDYLVSQVIKNKQDKNIVLCYQGPRYKSTYQAWIQKDFQFPYTHICNPINKIFLRKFYSYEKQLLQFDSNFECGNLDAAFKVGENSYQLYMRVDTNTRGHFQWFNFKVKKLRKGVEYKFSICNFQKAMLLYGKKMKPYIFSKRGWENRGETWKQRGQHIRYSRSQSKVRKKYNQEQQKSNRFYKLKFRYCCQEQDDEIQIAYCVPYTYTQMRKFLEQSEKAVKDSSFLKISKLGTSLGGLQIPLLTITNNIQQLNQAQKSNQRIQKQVVIATARTHPSQSNASYMVEGFIKFLTSNNPQAELLRNKIIFKIVPMLNPDGVALGNHRTGIFGKDLNRQFTQTDKIIFPEIYHLKQLVRQMKSIYGRDVLMFLDFHGHSVKKNVFTYGPQYSLVNKNYYECRIFPKLIQNRADMFRYYSCVFKVSQLKQSTARAVMFRYFNIPLTYTIEASTSFYYCKQQLQQVEFTDKSWLLMGHKIGQSLWEYFEIKQEIQKKKLERAKERKQNAEKKDKIKDLMKQKRILTSHRKQFKTSINFNRNDNSPIKADDYSNNIFQSLDNKKVLSLMQQIQSEELFKRNNYNSEDQINEGDSDAQSESNDLDKINMEDLINHIKYRKTKAKRQNAKANVSIKTEPNPNLEIQKQGTQIIEQNSRKKRENFARKMYLIKRNSNQSFSPKRQDKGVAKILNFNFNLTAVPLYYNAQQKFVLGKDKYKDSMKKASYSGMIKQQKSTTRKIQTRESQSAENFRKNFISVPRQLKKREPISNKAPSFLIQNANRKRIDLQLHSIVQQIL